MKIYIIRHGATSWNSSGRWQGTTDIPLNDEGRAQSAAVAERLSRNGIAAVYSSVLERAYETAEIIAEKCGVSVIKNPLLAEIDLGKWEGKTISEIEILEDFKEWETSPDLAPHGGESYNEVKKRMVEAITEAAERENGDFAVVSHGGAIRAFFCYVLGLEVVFRFKFKLANASLTVINYDKENKEFTLETFNDYGHLEMNDN